MATFDAGIGMSLSMIPPCIVALVERWCFLATLRPSTMTMLRSGRTRVIAACLPTSLPVRTSTWSPFLSRIFTRSMSEHLRGERDDAHETPLPQLAAHGPEDARPSGLHLLVDEHRGVLVEADVAAVGSPPLLLGAHHDALHDLA